MKDTMRIQETTEKKPSLAGYLTLFAGSYVILLFLAGLAIKHFALESDFNNPVLFTAGLIVCGAFVYRHRRAFTAQEAIKLTLGAFAVDVAIQLGVTFVLTDEYEWLANWLVWFVLCLHLVSLFLTFKFMPKLFMKGITMDRSQPSSR